MYSSPPGYQLYAINPKMMLMKATIKKKRSIGFLIKIEVHPMVCCIVDEKKIVISNLIISILTSQKNR